MIRVIVVDDQSLYREAVTIILSASPGIEVLAEATNGKEALDLCEKHQPDVVLMDLHMPVMDGVMAIKHLTNQHPAIKVLALTVFDDEGHVVAALRAGAVGYLLKDVSAENLREAVRAAARGSSTLAPEVTTHVVRELRREPARPSSPRALRDPLSARELEVLKRLGRGASNKEIATELSISEGTVKNHVTAILQKLEVTDRTQAALRARDLGLA